MALAFLLSIAASLLCVIYGLVKWNESGLSSDAMRTLQEDEESSATRYH
ncbi:MAG: hypothetical protein KQJ78_21510 [Deltaproteobacteria bacterium]|nr:hypothetical protein [Deltaproteobacteria bacterium]